MQRTIFEKREKLAQGIEWTWDSNSDGSFRQQSLLTYRDVCSEIANGET